MPPAYSPHNNLPPLTRLSHEQWSNLNKLLTDLHSAESTEVLMDIVANALPVTLEADWAVWNEHNHQVQLDKIHVTKGREDICQPLIPVVNELMHTHPIIEAIGMIGNIGQDKNVWSFTDFKSSQSLRNVPIWHEVYQHIEVQNQLLTQLYTSEKRGITLTVNSVKAFSEEQRTMVTILRDHLEIVCRRLVIMDTLSISPEGKVSLTIREQEVFVQLMAGKTNIEIGIILGISSRTVEKHVSNILEKYEVENRNSLIAQVHRQYHNGNGAH